MDLLPSTAYRPPSRQVRKHVLNTIIEDPHSDSEQSGYDGGQANHSRTNSSSTLISGLSSSPVSSFTSSISSYYRTHRHSEDYDDLYDVSDDDDSKDHDLGPPSKRFLSSQRADPPDKFDHGPAKNRGRYPSLVIPSPTEWPTIQKLQRVGPCPPPKIPISPAVLSLLSAEPPSSSHPPSLDGSLVSDPLASSSGAVTPDLELSPKSGNPWDPADNEQSLGDHWPKGPPDRSAISEPQILKDDTGQWDHVVGYSYEDGTIARDFALDPEMALPESPTMEINLPPDAMETLQHLSNDVPQDSDVERDKEAGEMEEIQLQPSRPSSADMTPASQGSQYSLSDLSIPSPGGFLASLNANARHTWCFAKSEPVSAIPPSSTTAENFYNCPWNIDSKIIAGRIVEPSDDDTEGPPTARRKPPEQYHDSPRATGAEGQLDQINHPPDPVDYDEDYDQVIQSVAKRSLDRTSVWLAAQTAYMAALRETNPINDLNIQDTRRVSTHLRNVSLDSPLKKAVRFLVMETAKQRLPGLENSHHGDSIFYHAFQNICNNRRRLDTFRHRYTRSDSIQAVRVGVLHAHIDWLKGRFRITNAERPTPLRPISMMPGKDSDADEPTAEQKVITRVERERQALEQVLASAWIIEAFRFLIGGRLLYSPVGKTLAQVYLPRVKTPPDRTRKVLDLGGPPHCDWGWHCARDYPNARIHTATTEDEALDPDIYGPQNHRCTKLSRLWELPYADSHFDAVSARSLFIFLKNEKPLGQIIDEYDLCLKECYRCLKPGGYLEFFLIDSEIVNSGPRGTATSVEFGFNLKTRGYDPCPTKPWLARVQRAGFKNIRRAWTFLPMGAPPERHGMPPETPPPNISTANERPVEAVQGAVGSTADVASQSGLVGAWSWERWMLKLQLEMGKDKEELLEGVSSVLEEGKSTRAGWRCLCGWARKPWK